jgi:STAS domain
MPACTPEREVDGSTAFYRISGRFDGACAWDLAGRLEQEPLQDLKVDFSQVTEFVDYGIAVLASAIVSSEKQISLQGLRQHQERVFKYFGIDPEDAPWARTPPPALPEGSGAGSAKEVA